MAEDRVTNPEVESPVASTGVLVTAADYDALVRDLESLRSSHRVELAEQLRVARAFGAAAENDELLAVMEEAAIDEARIAQLEKLVRCAAIVEAGTASDGGAGFGSSVRVADDGGRATEYELVGRRSSESGRRQVSLASPVGKALLGARAGDVVRVVLPGGRERRLEVLDVVGGFRVPPSGARQDAAEAA